MKRELRLRADRQPHRALRRGRHLHDRNCPTSSTVCFTLSNQSIEGAARVAHQISEQIPRPEHQGAAGADAHRGRREGEGWTPAGRWPARRFEGFPQGMTDGATDDATGPRSRSRTGRSTPTRRSWPPSATPRARRPRCWPSFERLTGAVTAGRRDRACRRWPTSCGCSTRRRSPVGRRPRLTQVVPVATRPRTGCGRTGSRPSSTRTGFRVDAAGAPCHRWRANSAGRGIASRPSPRTHRRAAPPAYMHSPQAPGRCGGRYRRRTRAGIRGSSSRSGSATCSITEPFSEPTASSTWPTGRTPAGDGAAAVGLGPASAACRSGGRTGRRAALPRYRSRGSGTSRPGTPTSPAAPRPWNSCATSSPAAAPVVLVAAGAVRPGRGRQDPAGAGVRAPFHGRLRPGLVGAVGAARARSA